MKTVLGSMYFYFKETNKQMINSKIPKKQANRELAVLWAVLLSLVNSFGNYKLAAKIHSLNIL